MADHSDQYGAPKTTAPTNQATLDGVTKQGSMTEEQLVFVTFVSQHWMLHGVLLSQETAEEKYQFSKPEFLTLMTNAKVRAALTERGVKLSAPLNENTPWKDFSLSPVQLIVANTMLDIIDTRSDKKKLQDLGISPATWQAWLRDPVFQDYLSTRSGLLLNDSQHEANLALLDKVRSGDIKAIEYFHEFTGRFQRASKSGPAGGGAPGVLNDVQGLIIGIIEIITDEVDDPDTAARIADRLKSLANVRSVAKELMNPGGVGAGEVNGGIAQPIIAKARVMTPELEKLMDHGDGM